MKKSFVFAALFALASIGLVFVGCNNGGGGNPPTTDTYSGTDNSGNTYSLVITESAARTAIPGDTYVLTITASGSKKISSGTVSGNTGGVLTLQPSKANAPTFKVTASSGGITEITGKITLDNGDQMDEPTSITPNTLVGVWQKDGVKAVFSTNHFAVIGTTDGTYSCNGSTLVFNGDTTCSVTFGYNNITVSGYSSALPELTGTNTGLNGTWTKAASDNASLVGTWTHAGISITFGADNSYSVPSLNKTGTFLFDAAAGTNTLDKNTVFTTTLSSTTFTITAANNPTYSDMKGVWTKQ
jgi:hypothetical protein